MRDAMGRDRSLEADETETLQQVGERLVAKYYTDLPYTVTFLHNGNQLNDKRTVRDHKLTEESRIIIVARPPKQSEPDTRPQVVPPRQSTDEASIPQPPQPQEPQPQEPQPQPQEPQPEAELSYTRVYSGAEILQAIKVDALIIVNIMNLIAQTNPFYLSYLATNPDAAKDHLLTTLRSPDFTLRVKCESIEQDPVLPALMCPQGPNPYLVDKANIDYLLSEVGFDNTQFERVKERYLFCDRNIPRTLESLRGAYLRTSPRESSD